jgi:hypothetical protein
VTDPRYQSLLWTARGLLRLCTKPSEFTSLEPFLQSRRNLIDGEVIRVTPEMERPSAIFWSDVQFLMIAVKHLEGVLEMLGPGAPRLDKVMGAEAVELRHLLEQWWKATA